MSPQARFEGGSHDGDRQSHDTILDEVYFPDGERYIRAAPGFSHSVNSGPEVITYVHTGALANPNDRSISDNDDGQTDDSRAITDV